ncbi:MAG TPA: VIT1/CCC1 transporter family protein [Candidatus Saccharimonadales bacterium]
MTKPEESTNSKFNKLRAAVLGANDGIVSTSSVVMGVAGAGADNKAIFTAGMAALVAGALSMAVGEYVSVGSQRDAEEVHVKKVHGETPDDHEFTSPIQAAVASLASFSVGGLVPFLAVVLAPTEFKVWATVGAVLVALLLTGYFSAMAGNAPKLRAVTRVIVGGLLAMAITYYIGVAFGAVIA